MEAKNLRIGNLVKYENRAFKIHSLSEELVLLDTDEFGIGVVDWNNLKPIELTEEWLKKLGFDDSNYKAGYVGIDSKSSNGMITDFVITKPKHMGEWQNYYAFDLPSHRFSTINYVHELQNLFNAITGHELEIK